MKLFDSILEVRFKTKANLIENDKRLTLIKNITDENPKDPDLAGVQVSNPQKKLLVVSEDTRYAIAFQHNDLNRTLLKIKEIIDTVDVTIGYSGLVVSRIGFKSVWIEKTNFSMEQLITKYKNAFFQNTELIDESVDVSVPLTLANGNVKINYMTGPVGKDEANIHITFPISNFNSANIMVTTDCYLQPERVYSLDEVKEFVVESLDYGKTKAAQTYSELMVEE